MAHGSTEVWEITAIDGSPHNFHVHDVQFQVPSVGNEPPPPRLRGWKDTTHTLARARTSRLRTDDPDCTRGNSSPATQQIVTAH